MTTESMTINHALGFADLLPLSPVLIVCVTVMLVMILVAINRSHFLAATASVIGLNLALISLIKPFLPYLVTFISGGTEALQAHHDMDAVMQQLTSQSVGSVFIVDGFAKLYMLLILIGSLATCTLSYYYIESFDENKAELYLLILLATIGAMLMVCANNLASFFVSLELLSVPMYGMLAYTHERSKSLEAAVKYLVLSATASATMLMGMAFIYAYAGSLDYIAINKALVYGLNNPLFITGAFMMLCGIAFKLSLAPFHAWTPDIYQGAPAPVATFLATVSKAAMFALVVRFFIKTATPAIDAIDSVLTVLAVLSILLGNLLALKQSNLKRLLGYSSIAHFGYALVAIITLGQQSFLIANIYMVAYVLTSIAAFGVLTLMSVPYRKNLDASNLSEYRGMFWRRPVLTAVMTVMMLSFAGIPLTVGFISKFFVVLAAVQSQSFFLAGMIILGSGIGLYYYLKVMVVLYMTPPETPNFDAQQNWAGQFGGVVVLIMTVLVILLGVYPQPLIDLAELAGMG